MNYMNEAEINVALKKLEGRLTSFNDNIGKLACSIVADSQNPSKADGNTVYLERLATILSLVKGNSHTQFVKWAGVAIHHNVKLRPKLDKSEKFFGKKIKDTPPLMTWEQFLLVSPDFRVWGKKTEEEGFTIEKFDKLVGRLVGLQEEFNNILLHFGVERQEGETVAKTVNKVKAAYYRDFC